MKRVDGRCLSPEAQEERRRQALRLREELQWTWKEIARVVGVHISTVIGWGQRYGRDGEAGLKARRRGRRYLTGRTLTLAQEGRVRSILVDETPGQRGLGFALWNRRAVMELIEALFGVAMPIRTVGEYLLRWGYTPQRPIKRALEQRPAEVQRWLDETYPAILDRAKAEKALIDWGDETAVVEDGHCLRGYAPKGKTPVLATPSRRSGLALVSAIRNLGLVRFRFIEQAMNANLLIEFLGQLIADSPQVFLILDNLKVHHAKAVKSITPRPSPAGSANTPNGSNCSTCRPTPRAQSDRIPQPGFQNALAVISAFFYTPSLTAKSPELPATPWQHARAGQALFQPPCSPLHYL